MGTHKQHHHWTYSSDETSEEKLASQIASHVSQIPISEGGISVLVVASLSFQKMLTSLLPVGAVVKADHKAPLSAGFGVRVTVVASLSTATFELKSVRKVRKGVGTVTPTPKTELVDIGKQKWAKTNVSAVYDGLIKTDELTLTEFVNRTNNGEAACFETPAGDMLYNVYVDFDMLLPKMDPTMTVPTEDDLKNLVSYYEDTFKAGDSKEEQERAMRDRVDAIKRDLGVKPVGIFVTKKGEVAPGFEVWWAHDKSDKSSVFHIIDSAKKAYVSVEPLRANGPTLGLSVRLIQKPTAA
jgi:hypothetical protein